MANNINTNNAIKDFNASKITYLDVMKYLTSVKPTVKEYLNWLEETAIPHLVDPNGELLEEFEYVKYLCQLDDCEDTKQIMLLDFQINKIDDLILDAKTITLSQLSELIK